MRLVCPNCDAQYEVDDAVIPEEGRDVQCSSCGHTWFQESASAMALPDDDLTDYPAPPTFEPSDEDGPAEEIEVAAPEPESFDDPELETPEPAPRRKPIDESVLDVLREEAARESEARRSEARSAPLESQPGLGLDDGRRNRPQ